MKRLLIGPAAVLVLGALLVPAAPAAGVDAPAEPRVAAPTVQVRVQEVMSGLDHPWDVAFTPDGTMLVTERERERIVARLPDGTRRVLAENPTGVWHSGETGLMGIEVHPDFGANRIIYTCHGSDAGRAPDVRVVQWTIDTAMTAATQVKPIVRGMPATTGRHGGCRLRFAPNGALYIGTGDAAEGTNPQDLTSLGGKVLRVNPENGRGFKLNPFRDSENLNTRRIWTYGHRNVQGLAYRTGDVTRGMWSVEHGPDRDDEINQLQSGGNAGWNPVPGYNESVPMTDPGLGENVFAARWSSGVPTLATSGATWLTHAQWGPWQGRLAVATLKDTSLRLYGFGPNGGLLGQEQIVDLDNSFGRLRTAQTGPGGALYVTTDNGGGTDRVLKVTAR